MFVTICFGKKWKRWKTSDFHFGQDYSAKIIKGNRILFDLYSIIESEWGAIRSIWCQSFSCTDLIYFLPSLYQVRPIPLVGVIIFSHKVLTEMVLMISALANSSSLPGVGVCTQSWVETGSRQLEIYCSIIFNLHWSIKMIKNFKPAATRQQNPNTGPSSATLVSCHEAGSDGNIY